MDTEAIAPTPSQGKDEGRETFKIGEQIFRFVLDPTMPPDTMEMRCGKSVVRVTGLDPEPDSPASVPSVEGGVDDAALAHVLEHLEGALAINSKYGRGTENICESLKRAIATITTLRSRTVSAEGVDTVAALGCHAFASSDKHLSGYRLTLGFDTLEQVQDAHKAIVDLGKRLRAAKES